MVAIYKIQSILFPEKIYIGSSIDFHKRKGKHIADFIRGNHGNSKLRNHCKKYGVDDLVFTIVEEVDDKMYLISREQHYIDTLKPFFNINLKADSSLGVKRTEEYKQNMSKVLTGIRHSKFSIAKSNHLKSVRPFMTKPHSPESREKIRLANCKAVYQFDIYGNYIRTWSSIKEAGETLKIAQYSITRVCRGSRTSTCGMLFRYAEKREKKQMKLTKPICFFDTETTSKKAATARIVSLSIIKYNPDGSIESKNSLINPGFPIPKETTEIHGISDEMVANSPLFHQVAKSIAEFIKGCDLAGYNIIAYDIVVIIEEFLRAGLTLDLGGVNLLDPCTIFKKKEERNLSAALRFYTGETLEDAHSATADTIASIKVLLAQTEYYPELKEMSIQQLADFCKYDGPEKIDLSGVFLKDADGEAVYAFGKHQGEKVKSCPTKYLQWLIGDANYTMQTKKVAEQLYDTYFKK